MEQSKKDQLKKQLIEQINTKQQIIESGKTELSTLEHGAPDEADQSAANESQETIAALNKKHRTDIAKMMAALRNMNSEDYGYCEDCGVEIPFERLEARPDSTTCIDCGNIREHKAKHHRQAA